MTEELQTLGIVSIHHKDTRKILGDASLLESIVEDNYEKGKRYFSYANLHQKLSNLLSDCFSCVL